jgi:hypothetical protein
MHAVSCGGKICLWGQGVLTPHDIETVSDFVSKLRSRRTDDRFRKRGVPVSEMRIAGNENRLAVLFIQGGTLHKKFC